MKIGLMPIAMRPPGKANNLNRGFQAYRYEPPPGDAGRACVASCAAHRDTCRTDCRAAWQACGARIEPEVEPRHAAALRDWAADLRRYQAALERYEWELWQSRSSYYAGPWYHPWHSPWPPAPLYAPRPAPPGTEPTRESIRAELLRQECKDDCGCQEQYDGCYQACGGRRIAEVRCVAHCRAADSTDPAPARNQ